MKRVKSLLLVHQYLNITNQLFNITHQSSQVLYLAFRLVCLKKQHAGKFM